MEAARTVKKKGQDKPYERRLSIRYPWKTFTGQAIIPEEQREFNFQPIDISADGICFASSELIEFGNPVLLISNNRAVRLEVVWMEEDESGEGVYRYGLRKLNTKQNLVEIFAD